MKFSPHMNRAENLPEPLNDMGCATVTVSTIMMAIAIKRGLVRGERNGFQAHRRVWWREIAEDTAARLKRLATPLRRI